jgi:hypothetical protein
MTTQKRVALALTLLVLGAAVALTWLVRTGAGSGSGVTTAESADASVASASVKDTVLGVADEAATRVYSYSWETLADDKADARALLTGDMLRQYDRTMAGVATSSQRDRTVVSADVVGTGLVTATSSYARVLVFVNQSTKGEGLDEPRLDLDRVLVTLVRTGGEWKVSELDAL